MLRIQRPPRRSWLVGLIGVVCVGLPACGFSHGPDFAIGFRRVALDLSYKDEALAKPPTHQDIVIPQPVVSNGAFVTFQPPPVAFPTERAEPTPLPKAPIDTCPAAGPDAHPDQPVTVFTTTAPAAGTYLLHNSGTFTTGAPVQATLPMPKHSLIQIQNVQPSQTSDPVNGPTNIITYDVVQPGIAGSTTTTYRTTYSPSPVVSTVEQAAQQSHAPSGELDLVHLVIKAGTTTIDFQPDPPVTIMAFKNGEGTSWNSAGIDQRDGTSMAVQGSITKRTNVDLCGKVYDTYEVVSNEHVANLRTGLTSNTDPSDPNVYDVATQYGGLFLRQHVATTTTFPTDSGTTTIISKYDQVFDSITPAG